MSEQAEAPPEQSAGNGRYGRRPGPPLAELHVHVGGAVEPSILYSMAHAQGIRLPVTGYWGFVALMLTGWGVVRWRAVRKRSSSAA